MFGPPKVGPCIVFGAGGLNGRAVTVLLDNEGACCSRREAIEICFLDMPKRCGSVWQKAACRPFLVGLMRHNRTFS